jgi:mono/diheme cytochrome c family protein
MKKILLAVLVLAAFALAACGGNGSEGGAEDVSTPGAVPAEFAGQIIPLGTDAATAGAEVFKNNCTACHGEQGHGDGPAAAAINPRPRNLPELAKIVADDYLFWRISTGKPGTSMVAWKGVLTDEEIWQVVAFIRTLK